MSEQNNVDESRDAKMARVVAELKQKNAALIEKRKRDGFGVSTENKTMTQKAYAEEVAAAKRNKASKKLDELIKRTQYETRKELELFFVKFAALASVAAFLLFMAASSLINFLDRVQPSLHESEIPGFGVSSGEYTRRQNCLIGGC